MCLCSWLLLGARVAAREAGLQSVASGLHAAVMRGSISLMTLAAFRSGIIEPTG